MKLKIYLMVFSVRIRIQWGMGRFCFCFLANFFLILNDFWEGCVGGQTKIQIPLTFLQMRQRRVGTSYLFQACDDPTYTEMVPSLKRDIKSTPFPTPKPFGGPEKIIPKVIMTLRRRETFCEIRNPSKTPVVFKLCCQSFQTVP